MKLKKKLKILKKNINYDNEKIFELENNKEDDNEKIIKEKNEFL